MEQKTTLGLRLRSFVAKLKPTWLDRHDFFAAVGFGLFIRGVAMYSHPLAYIAAGVVLFVFSYLTANPGTAQPQQPQEQ